MGTNIMAAQALIGAADMAANTNAGSGRLIISALAGLAILLVLIIAVKVQAIIAILISAVAIGIMAGMPFSAIIDSVGTGMGNTLKGIALLVGLGSIITKNGRFAQAVSMFIACANLPDNGNSWFHRGLFHRNILYGV